MPQYEYQCGACGVVEKFHAMGEAPARETCPHCRGSVKRVFSAPLLGRIPGASRAAFEQAEKSGHEPAVVRREQERPNGSGSPAAGGPGTAGSGGAGSGDANSASQTNPALTKLVGKEKARHLRTAPHSAKRT